MPTIKPQFVNGELYHIYNRGVEKRNIYRNNNDYLRFLYGLLEFNDENYIIIRDEIPKEFRYYRGQTPVISSMSATPKTHPPKPLVEILCFCLMPNHFHLILRQIKEGGISLFMQKLGSGYTGYFNLKYERVGSLFQGTYKAVLIDKDIYLRHLFYYIHLNPVELLNPNWKEGKIKDWKAINEFLESYNWSSYPDYVGKENYPTLIKKDFFLELFGGPNGCKQSIREWLLNEMDLNLIAKLMLED